ncbi:hypothetical protein SAMD00079811_38280 [Scytonema sp. HK-05]|uniref:hypothetical protein n=1 Tax=Scytonema sp. HK-05 TaxID=1137095 RepID=UPI000AB8A43F|nr:hypothetical protein [Scytonema sp. HK-05]BAY46220.1 hypothetical protein SAMD00079811_38280 [Scytonema sp. HK-05]
MIWTGKEGDRPRGKLPLITAPHPNDWLRQTSPPRLRGGVRGGVFRILRVIERT